MFRLISSTVAALLVIVHAAPLVAQNVVPNKVFVVNTQDASVSLVDLKAMSEEKRFPVGQRPYGIAVMPDARTFAVGVEDEETVKFFALPGGELKGKVPIGKMFNDHLVLTPDGKRLLLANFYSDDVVIIDPAEMKEVGRIEGCSAPHVVKYGPLKKNAYVTCKKITGIAIIDSANQQLVKFHQLNVNPRSLTFAPDESKVYFGSFWVNGFFEMETETGKVSRLFSFDPPAASSGNQEVTYHGVEAVSPNAVLAANEGRSYVDSVDVTTGKLQDRLTSVSKPCCVERIPGTSPVKVLVSNLGDGSLQMVEVADNGKLKDLGRVKVGAAPKRVAFLPPTAK
jgi:DNA-binding beta-propeller fold protein YncE